MYKKPITGRVVLKEIVEIDGIVKAIATEILYKNSGLMVDFQNEIR